jgi:hypothetical protein
MELSSGTPEQFASFRKAAMSWTDSDPTGREGNLERVAINALPKSGRVARLSNTSDALGNPSCALGDFVWHRPAADGQIHC